MAHRFSVWVLLPLRSFAIVLLVAFMCAFSALGCRIEHSPLREPSANGVRLPAITAERLQACVNDYADEIASGSYEFRPTVQVDENTGGVVGVEARDIPLTAPNLAACTRTVLREMAVPAWVLNLRLSRSLASTNGQPLPPRDTLGTVFVFGVAIAFGEIVVQAGGVTVLFAVAVQLVHAAVKKLDDVFDEESERERCRKVLEMCIAKCTEETLPTGTLNGDPFFICRRRCLEAENCWGRTH